MKIRGGCIGASDVAAVIGENKYEKAHTFWKRKTGRLKAKDLNSAMLRGAELEEPARNKIKVHLIKEEGVESPEVVPYFALHPKYPFIGISFDGVDLKNKFITEIKCPERPWNFTKIFTDGVPEHYYPQVQLQLMVAKEIWGIDKAYFCSYYPEGAYILDNESYIEYLKDLVVIDVDYDEKFINAMQKLVAKFWKFVEFDYWDQTEYDEMVEIFRSEKC